MAKFSVSYTFHGRSSDIIEASSLEEATALIDAKVEDDDFDPGTENIDDVTFDVQEMHPVTRDGREIWTTYIKADDVRGHQSAVDNSPLFAPANDNKEAALGAVATQ